MAQGATVYQFNINLSDVDRGVYETLSLKVAQHPTETLDYMLMRVFAYCLEFCEGIKFGESVGTTGGEQAAVWARDAQGNLTLWVEVGWPDADKLHRASKASDRCAIYTHRDPFQLKNILRGKSIYRVDDIPLVSFDKGFLQQLIERLDRRTTLDVSITERTMYVTLGDTSFETRVIEDRINS
jgi:uncharacterized protein YaeQ